MAEESIIYFTNYKIYKGQKYVCTFPDEWILNELTTTGNECENCKWYGSWRGVILGYCCNCANYCYYYDRGLGFIGHGVENHYEKSQSATMTYLLDIDLENIGNINENPDDTMENHYNTKKNMNYQILEYEEEELEQEVKDEMRNHYDSFEFLR